MKRIVCIMIVLIMVLAMVGCGGGGSGASNSKYIGTWTMTSVDVFGDGEESAAKDLDMSGTLVVKSDGKVDITLGSDKSTDKWQEKEGKLVLDSGMTGEIKDGRLAMDVFGVIMYFTK